MPSLYTSDEHNDTRIPVNKEREPNAYNLGSSMRKETEAHVPNFGDENDTQFERRDQMKKNHKKRLNETAWEGTPKMIAEILFQCSN